MPQLDVATFAPQLIWLAILFVVLYLLMANLGLPRLSGIIRRRRGQIEGDIEKAGQMKAEADAVIAAYERALAEARSEAQQTLKETTERLNAEAAKRQHQIAEKLAGETAAAERRIAAAKNAALAQLRDVAVEVTMSAAEKLAGSKIDGGRAGRAVDAVLKERG